MESSKSTLIKERIGRAYDLLKCCRLCGHGCGVNRISGEQGICRSGTEAEIASYTAHHGEEPSISGQKGSGAIFFAHCNLSCVFCQNWEISQAIHDDPQSFVVGAGGRLPLHTIMLDLQSRGCHNINLVTPTHFMPQILDALRIAFEKGLDIPIVYNTNGYDSVELLQLLDGIVDIYMPDFKYFDDEKAKKYSNADNYAETARAGIEEMFRQAGNLQMDENGIAKKGLIVRHLVLPNGISGSKEVIKYLSTVSKDMWISIMSQYTPQNRAGEYPGLNRPLLREEYWEAVEQAQKCGLENYLIQELSSKETYLPNFKNDTPFEF